MEQDLSSKKKSELRQMAADAGLTVPEHATKASLTSLLLENHVQEMEQDPSSKSPREHALKERKKSELRQMAADAGLTVPEHATKEKLTSLLLENHVHISGDSHQKK